jgi:hypothetical protein
MEDFDSLLSQRVEPSQKEFGLNLPSGSLQYMRIYMKRSHNQGKGICLADLGAQNRTNRTNCETNWIGNTDNSSAKSKTILAESGTESTDTGIKLAV